MQNEFTAIETLELFGALDAKFALLKPNQKRGNYKGWKEPKSYREALDHVLQGGNLALLNGALSGGLVTIDIDSGYSRIGNLLPTTVTVLRDNALDRGKVIYRVVGDRLPKYQAFTEPGSNKPLFEILSTGQTSTIPPSTLKQGNVSYVFPRVYNQLEDIRELEYGEFEELWNRLTGKELLPYETYQNDHKTNVGGIWTGSNPRMVGYAREGFRQELQLLASAQAGQRNVALNRAAFSLGQLMAEGLLDQHDVERELERVALEIGLSRQEIRPTIRSGIRAGERKGRYLDPKKFVTDSSDLQKQLQGLQVKLLIESWNNLSREKDSILGILRIAERADTIRALDISGYRLAKEALCHWHTAYCYLERLCRLGILERLEVNEEYSNYRYNLLLDNLLEYVYDDTPITSIPNVPNGSYTPITYNSLGKSYMSQKKQLFLNSPIWVKGANYVDGEGVKYSLGPLVRDIIIQLLDENGLTVSEISTRLGKPIYAISKKISALQVSGLVTKEPDEEDGRSYRLWLTQDLEQVIEQIEERTTTTAQIERRNKRIVDRQQQNRERQQALRMA